MLDLIYKGRKLAGICREGLKMYRKERILVLMGEILNKLTEKVKLYSILSF